LLLCQNLVVTKKSTVFTLTSWNLVKIIDSWESDIEWISAWSEQKCRFFVNGKFFGLVENFRHTSLVTDLCVKINFCFFSLSVVEAKFMFHLAMVLQSPSLVSCFSSMLTNLVLIPDVSYLGMTLQKHSISITCLELLLQVRFSQKLIEITPNIQNYSFLNETNDNLG